ncbi:MAG: hypothetical protein Q8S32_00950 [Burkholderiaceae bacterium]|nr:hypothetical protein [Burkholderiaceae bacterium]
MQTTSIQHSAATRRAIADLKQFTPLAHETRPTVDTAAAAHYLNRRPQTMRGWACLETFPEGLRPLRVNGRLAWPVAGIRKVLGVQ